MLNTFTTGHQMSSQQGEISLRDVKGIENISFEGMVKRMLENDCESYLSAYAEANGLTENEKSVVMEGLRKGLKWEWKEFDFLHTCSGKSIIPHLQLANGVFDYLDDSSQLELLLLASQYLNPHVPWSNEKKSEAAKKLSKRYQEFGSRFLAEIKPSLLSIPNVKVSSSGYKKTGRAAGLQPSLGFSGVGSGIFEDDKRKEWKHSADVCALSTVCGFLQIPNEDALFQENWPAAITFILNVLDDSDPLFRAQGCFLAHTILDTGHESVLLKSGLVDLFLESTETCLNYLPNLTPANVSFHLLQASYPLLVRLKSIRQATHLSYTEVLEKNILGSITHVQGRDYNNETISILAFLLSQAEAVIIEKLEGAVLGCFSRLNYTLCQLITDPFLIDTDGGAEVIDRALSVQLGCSKVFLQINDDQGSSLYASYKYDFLAAWVVLLRRVTKFKVGTSATMGLIKSNIEKLSALVGLEIVKEDYSDALERNPDSLPSWSVLIQ
ncbi:hypothetical protein FDK38_003965 [Candidozyma auris]|nr:hypothetical protein FDK38_003965 [[Candida] auris]